MSVNKAILVGNLGADPDLRSTQGGMQVCKLRIATTERKKDGDNWVNHTEWHNVTLFGRQADLAQKYLKKGRQVYIEGSIRTSKYTAKDGSEKWSTEIIGNDVKFLGSGGDGAKGKAEEGRSNDDIPF